MRWLAVSLGRPIHVTVLMLSAIGFGGVWSDTFVTELREWDASIARGALTQAALDGRDSIRTNGGECLAWMALGEEAC